MTAYVIRRLLLMVPVAFLVTVIVFALVRLAPGDPVLVYAGEERDPVSLDALRKEYGLDQPMPVQYAVWLGHVLQGDLGRSLLHDAARARGDPRARPGETLLRRHGAAPLGLGRARRGHALGGEPGSRSISWPPATLASVSLPNFFLGLISSPPPLARGALFPPGGYVAIAADPGDALRHLVLPTITLATASLAVNVRQVRLWPPRRLRPGVHPHRARQGPPARRASSSGTP